MQVDYHVHTLDFSDGQMTLAEAVEEAQRKAVPIGISDHWIEYLNTAEQLETYLDALDAHPVYKGLEVSLGHPFEVPNELIDRLDYIIGSIHSLEIDGERHYFEMDEYYAYVLGENPGFTGASPIWTRAALDQALEIFLHAIDTQPITILGHCTVIPPLFAKEDSYTDAWAERLISAAVAKGIAIEISNAWRQPHRRFLEMALTIGANFSFGSDAHHLRWVGDLTYPTQIAKEMQIPADRIFRLNI